MASSQGVLFTRQQLSQISFRLMMIAIQTDPCLDLNFMSRTLPSLVPLKPSCLLVNVIKILVCFVVFCRVLDPKGFTITLNVPHNHIYPIPFAVVQLSFFLCSLIGVFSSHAFVLRCQRERLSLLALQASLTIFLASSPNKLSVIHSSFFSFSFFFLSHSSDPVMSMFC